MARKPAPSPPHKKPARYNSYLRYSGLAFQLLITIAVCGWVGYKLDQYVENKYPIYMLILGFLGFAGALFQVYRSVSKE